MHLHLVEAACLAAEAASAEDTDIFSNSGEASDDDVDMDKLRCLPVALTCRYPSSVESRPSQGPGGQEGQGPGLAAPVTPASQVGAGGVSDRRGPAGGPRATSVPSSRPGPRLAVATINSTILATFKSCLPFLGGIGCVCTRAQIVVPRHS